MLPMNLYIIITGFYQLTSGLCSWKTLSYAMLIGQIFPQELTETAEACFATR
jgi:hypothetical protein